MLHFKIRNSKFRLNKHQYGNTQGYLLKTLKRAIRRSRLSVTSNQDQRKLFAPAALTIAIAMSCGSAWAAGGDGVTVAGVTGGAGGQDGTLANAVGQSGGFVAASNFGSGGGGGGVDLTTGNGAHGGSRGIGGTGTGVGAVLGTTGAVGNSGIPVNTAPTTITSNVTGGIGGAGQPFNANANTNGGGGGGGVGVSATADITISGASVTGGAGFGPVSGGGGGGGVGVFSTAKVSVTAGAQVTGGKGGGNVPTTTGGGGGGMGILLRPGGEIANSGSIIGGAGGASGINGGGGGDGGAAVQFAGGGGTVTNMMGGSIVGGVGGNVRTFGTGSVGQGGAGIKGADITVINEGVISGAMSGSYTIGGGTPTQANAIEFTGGVNSLEIRAGSQINGNVVAVAAGANDVFKLGGAANATFDVSTLGDTAQYRFFDNFVKTGTSTWTLNGTSTATAPWTIEEGKLVLNGSITSPLTVNAAGTLGGNGTVFGDVANNGTIAPGNSIGTFVINGNYAGNSGMLEIEGKFAGTGSPADRLLITGNATGMTTIKTINVGGTGAVTGSGNTDGISIVQVAGTTTANTFQLAGGYAAAGPYRYQLRTFDQVSSAASEVDPLLGAVPFYDYRLQSVVDASGNPVAVPQIAAYQGLPTGAVRYGASLLDSVHKRLGELRRLDAAGNEGQRNDEFFIRTQGSNNDVSGNRAAGYDQDIWFVQAGGNVFGKDMEDGARLRIGGTFSYGESQLNVDNSSVKVNLKGTTLAVTSTYQGAAGWYFDGVAQVTKYSSAINTVERGQTGSPDGLGYALSLEAGYPFELGGGLIIEPQAQLSYQKIKFDRFTDVDNISVDLRDGESLRGRFGGRIQKIFGANTTRAWLPYVEANLLHEFLGDGSIRASDVAFASDSLGTSLQLGGGIDAKVGANKIAFASVSYESGLSHAAADSWSGNVGMRIDF
jgi:outer membrane autotransporter protein